MQTIQALLLALPVMVRGHAYLYYPPPRGGANNNPNNGYCPQCQGSSSLPMPTCGKSSFLNFDGPVENLQMVGDKVKFTVKMTAHHMGHFQFRLCDRVINSSMGGYAREEACLNEHILERVRPEEVHADCGANDKRGDCQPYDEANPSYWYLPPMSDGPTFSFHYRLPRGFSCERCTLQWWWMTANSCTPHPDAYRCYFQKMQQQKWNAGAWCRGACSFAGSCPAVQRGAGSCGEQFKNCADVRIAPFSSSPMPSPTWSPATPGPAPTPQPTAPPSPEPEAESEEEEEEEEEEAEQEEEQEEEEEEEREQEEEEAEEEEEEEKDEATTVAPSPASGMVCTAIPGMNGGASDSTCRRCAEGYKWWPCNANLCRCTPSGSSGAPGGPSSAPTTAAPGMGCKATPGLNRGVSDRDCQKCTTGWAWWPCNEAILCTCAEGLAEVATATGKRVREHQFLGLIQQSDEVQKGAFGMQVSSSEVAALTEEL